MMDYEDDIGKFLSLTYKTDDGVTRRALGILKGIDDNGFMVLINAKDISKVTYINLSEVTIVDYFAQPVEGKE